MFRLCGYPPFYDDSQSKLFQKIIKAEFDFPSPEWDTVSCTAKDFVRSLLQKNPKNRLTADECFLHPFLDTNINWRVMRTVN